MGTTVFRIIAYEKKTKRDMIIAPSTGSLGTRESQGRKERKYWPIIVSQTAQAIVQNRHMDSKKKTIYKINEERFNHSWEAITNTGYKNEGILLN